MTDSIKRAGWWRRALAGGLDFWILFVVLGYAVAWLTGNISDDGGFHLSGWPAAAAFALMVAYFWIGWCYAGGTLGDRIFRIRRPQPD
jgi:uncharacterized RDD family membrane protein YckC